MEVARATPNIPRSSLRRWCRIIALGCALGLFFVAVNLLILQRLERLDHPFTISGDGVKNEVTHVIDLQLAAFRAGDFSSAYAFADSDLRRQFAPAAFEQMVKTSYPAMAISQTSNFGIILDNGGTAIVLVGVTVPANRVIHYQYILRRERGKWKISGVTRVRLGQDLA